jgi:hypothetical protein
VAPLTSKEEELKYVEPFEVLIERNRENGLDDEEQDIGSPFTGGR